MNVFLSLNLNLFQIPYFLNFFFSFDNNYSLSLNEIIFIILINKQTQSTIILQRSSEHQMRKNKNGLSLDTLLRHQMRIKELVKRINGYTPTFDKNESYRRPSPSFFREKRSIQQDKLFQENFKIIQKIEGAAAKIDTKHFPPINIEKKKKHKSLNHRKVKSPPKYVIKNEEDLLDQNIDLIQKLQSTQKKVDCWTSPVLQKSRITHQKEIRAKRQEMIDRFNKISKQLRKIKHSQFVQKYNKNKPNINQLQIFSRQKMHSHMKTTSTYITGNRPSFKRQNTNFGE